MNTEEIIKIKLLGSKRQGSSVLKKFLEVFKQLLTQYLVQRIYLMLLNLFKPLAQVADLKINLCCTSEEAMHYFS